MADIAMQPRWFADASHVIYTAAPVPALVTVGDRCESEDDCIGQRRGELAIEGVTGRRESQR